MKIEIRKSAVKDLRSISEPNRTRLHRKIKELEGFPDVPNIKRLTNFEPAYRLRVGDFRILFDVEEDRIVIGRVMHRKDAYR